MRRTAVIVAGVVGLVGLVSPAVAAWSTSGTGSASATARSLVAVSGASASASARTVTVTWTAGANPTGTVHRVTRGGATVCGAATTSCTETSVPPGTHTYSVVPVLGAAPWLGPAVTASVTVVGGKPTVAIGSSLPVSGATHGTNANNSKTNWNVDVITGTVTEGATVTITMRNTTTGQYASAVVRTANNSPERYTSATPVALSATVTGTGWSIAWDKLQFPLGTATADMVLTVTAQLAGENSDPVVRLYKWSNS